MREDADGRILVEINGRAIGAFDSLEAAARAVEAEHAAQLGASPDERTDAHPGQGGRVRRWG